MAPTAELTEMATRPAVFMARRSALVLVQKSEHQKYADTTGQRYTVKGLRHNFKDGRLETSDPELIEWLRNHELFGNSESGFFELEQKAPEPMQEMLAIAGAASRADVDALTEIVERERAGFGREMVLQAAEEALGALAEVAEAQPPADPPPPAPTELPPAMAAAFGIKPEGDPA